MPARTRTSSNNTNNSNNYPSSAVEEGEEARTTTTTTRQSSRFIFILYKKMLSSLKVYSICLLIFASFFWGWALKNTIGMDPPNFDLGIISFMTVMLTTSYLLAISNINADSSYTTNSSSSPFTRIGKLTRGLITASCLFVALNYILGAYIGYTQLHRLGFTIYCTIFAVLWFGIAGIGIKITATTSTTQSTAGERQNLC